MLFANCQIVAKEYESFDASHYKNNSGSIRLETEKFC